MTVSVFIATSVDGFIARPNKVHEALHRSLAHISYHVGQIVYIAKSVRGKDWTYLSIPPGKSAEYNQAPTGEHAASHQAALSERATRK
jgi:hypothetical protein